MYQKPSMKQAGAVAELSDEEGGLPCSLLLVPAPSDLARMSHFYKQAKRGNKTGDTHTQSSRVATQRSARERLAKGERNDHQCRRSADGGRMLLARQLLIKAPPCRFQVNAHSASLFVLRDIHRFFFPLCVTQRKTTRGH